MPRLREKILDFFFPKRCLGCGRIEDFICGVCLEKLPNLDVQYCAVCNRPTVGGFTHERCRGRFRPDRFFCLYAFEGLAKELIHRFKYQGVAAIKDFLAPILTEFLEENNVGLGSETIIIFVPSHPLKFLERGFNQSQLIAEALGKSLNLKVLSALEKIEETKSQTELSRLEREENIKGSFALRSDVESLVKGRDVLLVDDVFTTGATLLECAKILKKSGVRFLYLLTLARD